MSAKKACLEHRRKEPHSRPRAAAHSPKKACPELSRRACRPTVIRDFLRTEPRQVHTRRGRR